MKDRHPMMVCGHAAQGICRESNGVKFNPPIPSCLICSCLEINKDPPNLEGRLAKCSYRAKRNGLKHEPEATKPSSSALAFFEYKPDSEFDRYYCGCHGWD